MSKETQRLATAQKAYEKARDEHSSMSAIEKWAQRCVLSENTFYVADEWIEGPGKGDKIMDPRSDYLMDDDSFTLYCQLVHNRLALSGYNIPLENTATYQTAPALKAAEEELIDASIPFMPALAVAQLPRMRDHWKYRAELIELSKMLDPHFVGSRTANTMRASAR